MATIEYSWNDMRDRGIAAFNGETPGDTIEAAIVQHFREHPGRVLTTIDAVGRGVAEGRIRSGWAILAKELEHTPSSVVATDNRERQQHLRNAEHWIHNTGGYIDRQSELVDCLFGLTGPLRNWPELEPQLVAAWKRERPRFETAEVETETRARTFTDTRARLRKATTHAGGNAEADEHVARVHAEIERARLAYLDTIAPDPEDDQ